MKNIKRLFILFIIAIFIPAICYADSQTEETVEITFNDTNLYNEIVSQFNDDITEKDDESKTIKITSSKLGEINFINLSGKSIEDLSGIENFTEVTVLNLNSNKISNLQPLAQLTKLTKLHLYNNQISSLEVIEKLTNLNELCLTGNEIIDISALQSLVNLEKLYLSEYYIGATGVDSSQGGGTSKTNNITDISSLEGLKNLKYLYLSGLKIDTIEPLKELTELKTLYIGNTLIDDDDLEVLKYFKNLEWLDLSENGISDISILKELPKLSIIELESNNISDISVLENFEKLEWLYLSYNKIEDISILDNIEIRSVRVNGQKIELEVDDTTIDLPKLLIQARDENSVGYTENEFEFVNCSLSEDGTKIILDEGAVEAKVSIKSEINNWSLAGSQITIKLNTREEEIEQKPEVEQEEQKNDPTISTEPIPDAGESVWLIFCGVVVLITCIVLFIKNKKYRNI